MFDCVIHNALLYDGTGNGEYRADLAIQNGKIAAIGNGLTDAASVLDASGLCLAPGFIDAHSHADESMFTCPERDFVLKMGVTTEIAGNCGHTLAPLAGAHERAVFHATLSAAGADEPLFPSFREEAEAAKRLSLGPNVAAFVGHGPIRYSVMGLSPRTATESELDAMCDLLDRAMDEGALGLTTGLSYEPGIYSDTRELVRLARVVARHGGIYATHSRSESAGIFDCIRECVTIARESGVHVHISHLKCTGREYWPRCETVLKMIDDANAEGLCVTMDAYPYTAVSTTTTSAIPPRFLANGRAALARALHDPAVCEAIRKEIFEIDDPGWDNSALHVGLENFLVTGADETPDFVGMTYAQIGDKLGISAFDAMMKLLRENGGNVRDVRYAMCEANVEAILAHPLCGVGSDGIYVKGRDTMTHPRALGAFPRYLSHYVRERGLLSRAEGIRRITGLPATRFGLTRKGFLKVGCDADLVLFDFETLRDGGTFFRPFLPNEGIRCVYMDGVPVVRDNVMTGERRGRFFTKNEL